MVFAQSKPHTRNNTGRGHGPTPALPSLATGLSARLLVLTVFFVMLSEVLIYAPSIARFRLVYLQEKLASAQLAALALDATPDRMITVELSEELLEHVGAYMIDLYQRNKNTHMLSAEKSPPAQATYDLREETFFGLIMDAFEVLANPAPRTIKVIGPSPHNLSVLVQVSIPEAPMRAAMLDYSARILNLSLLISFFTALAVYLSLHWLMVLPLRRLTESMMQFRENPEGGPQHLPSGLRSDEIGLATRELAAMQESLRVALHQKTRLAALGTGVTKINHDLRNILATAQLVSDRLATIEDAKVQRLAPPLMSAIDRAVTLCQQTLEFSREGPPPLNITKFPVAELVTSVSEELSLAGDIEIDCQVSPALQLEADRDQLYRVLLNLMRNSREAGAHRITVLASTDQPAERLDLTVADDGPGLPPRAIQNLFQPFAGRGRAGGTGLGLAIARELVLAHGGALSLAKSDAEGTAFLVMLPLSHDTNGHSRPVRSMQGDVGNA